MRKCLCYIKKVKCVNDIYDEHSRKGLSNATIYRNYIKEQFFISERTFYRFLKIDHENLIIKYKQQHETNR